MSGVVDPVAKYRLITPENRDTFLDDLKEIMGRAAGRRLIWAILGSSGITKNAMTGNSHTYFILGNQLLGNELMQILNTDRFLHLYRKMQDEALAATKAKLNANKDNKDETETD